MYSVHPAHNKLIWPTVFSRAAGAPDAGGSLRKKPGHPPQHCCSSVWGRRGLLRVVIRPVKCTLSSTPLEMRIPRPWSHLRRYSKQTPSSWPGRNGVNYFRPPQCPTGLPLRLSGTHSACNAGDLGSIPGSGRSPGEGNGSPLQYSCLGNPMDRGAWRGAVHGVTKSRTTMCNNKSILWGRHWQIYTTIYKLGKQQGLTV